MKSILAKNDVAIEELKNIGHDLEACLMRVGLYPEKEFVDTPLRQIVELLNPEYGKKHLEYHPGPRAMRLPSEADMEETLGKFIGGLRAHYTVSLRT